MDIAHCPLALAARVSDLWTQLLYDSNDEEFEVLSRTIAVHDGHGRFVRPLAPVSHQEAQS